LRWELSTDVLHWPKHADGNPSGTNKRSDVVRFAPGSLPLARYFWMSSTGN
jgi:hypothetical protein